ncbi:crossover junction endodeoxyribonuclease RuvC [Paenibacillus graminis]|uniref:crossover junction endodeoxyribonuclease RuvC n=1 Tax=Paenibacillus graminis TaxID=189425 RepID=UPI002DBD339F|nr:crossover junction endodeoxyribonuclease RuvC [Paenibacillus graminis]MEC0167895.1 crossover junction endodeoxyribonuclease RuvC [Paenibacillus graminis]
MIAKKPTQNKAKPKTPTARYAGLDLSLTSPGFAVIDVKNRVPTLVATSAVKTDAAESQPLRYEVIEAHALLFFRQHRPDSAIVREIWPPARNYEQNDKVHGAWSAVDRALSRLGLAVVENLSPSTVKKVVTGNGRAEKPQVAEAVRRYLRLGADYKFNAGYDESDAAAVALAYLLREDIIDEIGGIAA